MDGEQVKNAAADNSAQEQELSLRDEIAKNLSDLRSDNTQVDDPQKVKQPVEARTDKATPESPAKSASEEPAKAGNPSDKADAGAATAAEQKSKVPQSWGADDRQHWDKIPPEAQAVISRREQEVHRAITQMGEQASFGRQLGEVISPYLPTIRAEGGNPVGAVRDLLQTAYMFRTASSEQKVELFRQLANQFNVDLSAAAQAAPQVDPQVRALQQELAQMRGHMMGQERQQHQQVQVSAQQMIETFAADPKNEFYESVKPLMGQLMITGQAQTMQDAYDQACWATPGVRSTLLQRQSDEAETKRVAEAKAKADAKRRAAGSISGSPGSPVTTSTAANQNLSLREELQRNFRAATSPS